MCEMSRFEEGAEAGAALAPAVASTARKQLESVTIKTNKRSGISSLSFASHSRPRCRVIPGITEWRR